MARNDEGRSVASLWGDMLADAQRGEVVVCADRLCRRQGETKIEEIFTTLGQMGLRLHGFGVKTRGIARYAQYMVSSDSTAWSLDARRADPLLGHTHKNCANCIDWAMRWRQRVLDKIAC